MKNRVQKFFSGFLIFNAISVAICQDYNCLVKSGTCYLNFLREHGVSQSEINIISQAGLKGAGAGSSIFNNFSSDTVCKVFEAMRHCVPIVATGECANDQTLRTTIDLLPTVDNLYFTMGCKQSKTFPEVPVNHDGETKSVVQANCEYQGNKCTREAMVASEVTTNEINALLRSNTNLADHIDAIGQDRGCKFVQVFVECHDKIKNQCSADDHNFGPGLRLTKIAHDQLRCGSASTLASLLLIMALILVNLYYKSSL